MIKNQNFFFAGLILLGCTSGCQNPATKVDSNFINVSGEAQGTSYSITYLDSTGEKFSKAMADSLLDAIDLSLSTWVENSAISVFNQSDSIAVTDPHFLNMYFRGKEIGELTNGSFELKISPLVNAWGFGPEGAKPKGDVDVDSLLELVHTDFTVVPDTSASSESARFLFLKKAGQAVDVNGIAQGYTVDVMSDALKREGINDFMVEIGGEVSASGRNQDGNIWRIGIDKPLPPTEARELEAVVELNNLSMATSGSYRKFYEQDGKKYSHTIDPITGKPVDHNLLSVTVQALNCTNADAFATAFMVMGVDGTKQFIAENPQLDLEVFLIFGSEDGYETYTSSGFKKSMKNL
ncbi:MAG: FAD:protein FMN transferase [Cryomorphaceae bacterium]|nr:FAD:protein FMN transferase [Flavobacteriales bacterium]